MVFYAVLGYTFTAQAISVSASGVVRDLLHGVHNGVHSVYRDGVYCDGVYRDSTNCSSRNRFNCDDVPLSVINGITPRNIRAHSLIGIISDHIISDHDMVSNVTGNVISNVIRHVATGGICLLRSGYLRYVSDCVLNAAFFVCQTGTPELFEREVG